MTSGKVYIAGPMTGYPQFNIPAFDNMAAALRIAGFEVVSPAELDGEETRAILLQSPNGDRADYPVGMTHGDFLSRDVKLIADDGIDAIVVLPGWMRSPGARHETFVAFLEGKPTMYVSALIDGVIPVLDKVPRLELFRAWTDEPNLRVNGFFGRSLV